MELIMNQKEMNGQEFKHIILQDELLKNKVFTSCVFKKCSFQKSTFLNSKFQDCKFQDCDFGLVTLKECFFKNVLFEDSQIIGVSWVDTNLAQAKYFLGKPVDFIKCALNHSTFMGLNLKDIIITKCIAHNVSFEEANLSNSNCTYTDFLDSRFLNTNLSHADFTGAINYSISASLNTLKKTKFSFPEAMSLLYGLDIILSDYQKIESNNDESTSPTNK